ncbi:hypothetical protein H6784_03370 [Candidatus Nomurabacteria bacterium]|nr:hypothetical protein [Candidatus Kaiserbacteria bacterium]MCB9811133.1 hypothetical protein [Candidatus Nomurabacteria bacterium]MCB9814431.1 hypothetical protein [Candidatus Nomurabacteria bacterium]
MLTIYVSPHSHQLTTADGQVMTVRGVFVSKEGGLVSLRDFESPSDLEDVQIILVQGRLKHKILRLPMDLKQAIIRFLCEYHARINIEFDCYAFANMVKGVEIHKVHDMVAFWKTSHKPRRMPLGSIVFLLSGDNAFHHAAIYISSSLYISVYGAGGDFEVATLKAMKRDYHASEVVVAHPREIPLW